jgi:conjugal transfer pilus assembly protein TraV
MNPAAVASSVALAMAVSGCASTMSGVGGAERYACKAPEGALCTSVSGVYANSVQGLPLSPKPAEKKPTATSANYGASPIAPTRSAAAPGTSIRSNPRVLRLWIAPWEDADGDLHEEALVHVLVDAGRWLIEHVRPAVRTRMDGVAPPAAPAQTPPAAKPASDAPQPTRFPIPPGGLPSYPDASPAEH